MSRAPAAAGPFVAAVALAAVGTLLAGCGEAARPGVDAVRIDTVGGVVRVSNPAPSEGGTLDPLFSIGTATGDGPDAFGSIASVMSDADGRIYVADRIANRIRVFGPDGTFERSIGREGEGPGELGDLYSLAWFGDTLVALDPQNARISLFERDGSPAGLLRHQPLTGDGRFIRLFQVGPRAVATPSVMPVEGSILRQLVRIEADGTADTIPYPPDPLAGDEGRRGGIVCEYPDGGIGFFEIPFAPTYWVVPAPGALTATVWTGDYRVHFLSASGDTVRIVERDYTPLPTTAEAWEEGLAPFREAREERPGADCTPEDPARREFRPPVHLLFFDALGRMWVETEVEGGRAWDVFDREGRLIGSVAAPPRWESSVPWADAERLYVIARDELDVSYVHVYSLASTVLGA